MPTSTEAKLLRKKLANDGITDPFSLLAVALQRNAELQQQVDHLRAVVKQSQKKERLPAPTRLSLVQSA